MDAQTFVHNLETISTYHTQLKDHLIRESVNKALKEKGLPPLSYN